MTGDRINYQSIGSGGGIAQIKASTVTFGASDKPLSPQELSEVGLGQFPLVIGWRCTCRQSGWCCPRHLERLLAPFSQTSIWARSPSGMILRW